MIYDFESNKERNNTYQLDNMLKTLMLLFCIDKKNTHLILKLIY